MYFAFIEGKAPLPTLHRGEVKLNKFCLFRKWSADEGERRAREEDQGELTQKLKT